MTIAKPTFPILQRNHPLTAGLVAAWPFYQSGGIGYSFGVADLAGGYHGTFSGSTPCSWTGSQYGSAIVFNDPTTAIGTNFNLQLGDFTCCVLLNATVNMTTMGAARIIDKVYDNGFWMGVDVHSANAWGGGILESADPYGTFVGIPNLGQFHRLCMSRRGTTKIIWLDGKFGVASTVSNALTNSATLMMGKFPGGTGNSWTGCFAEVRIYNRALSAAEIAADYYDPFVIYRRTARYSLLGSSGPASQTLSASRFSDTGRKLGIPSFT